MHYFPTVCLFSSVVHGKTPMLNLVWSTSNVFHFCDVAHS